MGRKSIAETRRAEIIEAFHSCAVREGLHNASIRKIASEAGMKPGIIHHYFKDRDEMVEELVVGSAEGHIANFRNMMAGSETAEERLYMAMDYLFGPELFNNDSGSIFYDFWSEAKRNEKVRKSFSKVYVRFREIIIEFLSESGVVVHGMTQNDMAAVASVVIAMYEGTYLQWDMDRKNLDIERVKTLVKQLVFSQIICNDKVGVK